MTRKWKSGWIITLFLTLFLAAVFTVCLWISGMKRKMECETVTVLMPSHRNVDDLEMVQDAINKITERRYGIHFAFHMIPAANYRKNADVAMLNSDMDIIAATGKPLFEYVRNKQLEDLTPYMERASAQMKDVWPRECLDEVSLEGRLYGLPTFRNFGNYIGLDIDEEVALETGIMDGQQWGMEEVDEFLHMLKEKYPDRDILVPQGLDIMIGEWTWDGLGDTRYIGVLPDCGQTIRVQNLYETDDFVEFCTWMRKWNEDGLIMDNVLSNVEQWQNLIYQKKGIACFDNYGVNNVKGMIRTVIVDKWSKSNSCGDLVYGISTNSEHKETAWKGMEILYTDPEVEILLNNGIEGIHYLKNPDGTVSYPQGVTLLNCSYAMVEANWATPYSRDAYPLDINGADFAEKQEEFNEEALKSRALGFTFNPTPVVSEYEACCEVYDKYTPALMSGVLELEPALEKAKEEFQEAGIEVVIREKQRQLDEYLKEK